MLGVAIETLRDGTEEDWLATAIAGEIGHGERWNDLPSVDEKKAVKDRLSVLGAEGRHEEYLNLSRAAGRDYEHAAMLVETGRLQDGLEYGLEQFTSPKDARQLGELLYEMGATAEALQIGEYGLECDGRWYTELAIWVRDVAAECGETELSLEAAETVFERRPSLEAYLEVNSLAGDAWDDRRDTLLESLYTHADRRDRQRGILDVLVYEERYDEAIEFAEEHGTRGLQSVLAVKILEDRPEWAYETCLEQAMPIIERGKHDKYETAVEWLGHAAAAASEADRLDDWQETVESTREDHQRKYKLRPMLDELLEEWDEGETATN